MRPTGKARRREPTVSGLIQQAHRCVGLLSAAIVELQELSERQDAELAELREAAGHQSKSVA